MINLALALLLVCSLYVNNFYLNTKSNITGKNYTYFLVADSSLIEWKGASPKVSHRGAFALRSQGIEVVNGQIISGTFSIPIESISNYDLPKVTKPILLKHLKSKDFFHASVFPEATFQVSSVSWHNTFEKEAIAGANAIVKGELTMLGNKQALSFPARLTLQDKILALEALFTIDRTKWGMTHAAEPALGNRHIYPEVEIHLKVLASHQ